MPSLRDRVHQALRTVNDPELHKDLVTLNMIKRVEESDGHFSIEVELTTPACPLKKTSEDDVRAAVEPISGVKSVAVEFSANVAGRQTADEDLVPGVRNIIGVASGKGGFKVARIYGRRKQGRKFSFKEKFGTRLRLLFIPHSQKI